MKNKLMAGLGLALSAVTGVFAQNQSSTAPDFAPTVVVESEARQLSRAYAQAFAALVRPPFTMTLQKENRTYQIEDVRGVRDSGGVLTVEVGRGLICIVNPKDVVSISDGPAIKTIQTH